MGSMGVVASPVSQHRMLADTMYEPVDPDGDERTGGSMGGMSDMNDMMMLLSFCGRRRQVGASIPARPRPLSYGRHCKVPPRPRQSRAVRLVWQRDPPGTWRSQMEADSGLDSLRPRA